MVLLIRAAEKSKDKPEVFWVRVALGAMALWIYAVSYHGVQGRQRTPLRLCIFIPDVLEVGAIFICLGALGLADPSRHEDINYPLFLKALGIDILFIQTWWRLATLPHARLDDGAITRVGAIGLLAVGLYVPSWRIGIAIGGNNLGVPL